MIVPLGAGVFGWLAAARSRFWRGVLRVLLAVVVTVAAAACGGTDSPDPSPRTSADGAVGAPAQQPGPAAPAADQNVNPLARLPLYAVSGVQADVAADNVREQRPADAAVLDRIANTPTAIWLGAWNETKDVQANVTGILGTGRFAGALPVLALYRLPAHDCAGFTAAGPGSAEEYRAWMAEAVEGMRPGPAAVLLEPAVLGYLDCLGAADAETTYALLREVGQALTQAGAAVYLDISKEDPLPPAEAARRLRAAGVENVRGFALNISGFAETDDMLAYGQRVIAQLDPAVHFVVDTSRNGLGPPAGEWCNPPDVALGAPPTTHTGSAAADALLWVKTPGESDGDCNGGPPAGEFWVDYVLGLAARAGW